MDPPLVNDSSFSAANLPSYSLAEIWQFPVASATEDGLSGDKALALRMGGFGEGTSNRDASAEESTVTEQSGSRGKRRDATASEDESSKLVSTSSGPDMNISIPKRFKMGGSRDENDGTRIEAGTSSRGGKNTLEESKSSEPPKQDYIHVRARRGQATDSHSLAERARREKISERMKILQDLVPGCNKVIGKALVLDEIINYIQSLQRQVEFLSMKLEAVNARMNPTIEGFTPKELGAQTFDAPGMIYGSHTTREYAQESSQPERLHMQPGGNFGRAT